MNINVTSVVLGLGLAVSLAGTAAAGGSYSDIGIKTYRDAPAAVPVPAPVPIPVGPSAWYLRAEIGIGFSDKPGVTESGSRFGTTDSPGTTGPIPFGMNSGYGSTWFDNDFSTFVSGGVGAGYNWGRGFRTDVTAEMRSQSKVTGIGGYAYTRYEDVGLGYQATLPAVTVTGRIQDTTTVQSNVFLLNAYYDVTRWGPLTPFIGASIGFSYNTLERSQLWNETDGTTTSTSEDALKTHNFGLVAAATAGVSYEVAPSINLDLSYRYLWLQGMNVEMNTQHGPSRLTIADYGEHSIRSGLRFNID